MYIEFEKKKIPILYCNTFIKRLIGMSFKREKQNWVYCFPKCNSIHTFFMFQSIDVVMTDINNHILYTYENVKPNHIILPRKDVYYTYEFSHNENIINTLKQENIITIKNKEG